MPSNNSIGMLFKNLEKTISNKEINIVSPKNDFISFAEEDIRKNVVQKFKEIVKQHGEKIAIRINENSCSYRELDRKSDLLCQKIKELNNIKQRGVALICSYSIEMIISIIAILKSGKYYVPLDLNSPLNRMQYILNEAECDIIICSKENEHIVDELSYNEKNDFKKILFEEIQLLKGEVREDNSLEISYNDIAYILYTSGTTGCPKGVAQKHEYIMQLIDIYTKQAHICCEDNLSQLASYSFSASVIDIFGALLNGATLCPYEVKELGIVAFPNFINNNSISVLHMIPSLFRVVVEYNENKEFLKKIRLLYFGGEAAKNREYEYYKSFCSDECLLLNSYGSTEYNIVAQYFVDKESKISSQTLPVGFPNPIIELLLLNDDGKEVLPNQIGEFVVKTKFLPNGYWKNEKESQKKFKFLEDGTKMYYTGDKGRKLENGCYVYLGRADFQVKIRGYRVEILEIENQLMNYKKIKQSVVVASENNNDTELYVYYVADEDIDKNDINKYLNKLLPEYMIPTYYKRIPQIPLTRTGKIDRKKLIEQSVQSRKAYVAPVNEIQKKLCEIWEQVFNTKPIGINDDFFELGGHSLTMISMVSKIYSVLYIQLELRDLYDHPTIEQLSKICDVHQIETEIIPKAPEKDRYIASHAQKRMFFSNEIEKDNKAFNVTGGLRLKGNIDVKRVKLALKECVKRHESLRTYFVHEKSEIYQVISKEEIFDFKFVDLSNQPNENLTQHIEEMSMCFDLSKLPLIRFGLFKIKEEEYILIYNMHHIISDGTSLNILAKDFIYAYCGKDNEVLELQYKDFSEWQNNYLKTDKIEKAKKYWIQKFENEIPVLQLPTDYERQTIMKYVGEVYQFDVDSSLTLRLRDIAETNKVTLFSVLLSAFSILLMKLSDQNDIIVGLASTGRNRNEINNVIGMFINALPIRMNPTKNDSFMKYLKRVNDDVLSALQFQDYPFDMILDDIKYHREQGRNSVYDVIMNYRNFGNVEDIFKNHINELTVEPYEIERNISKYDIALMINEYNDGLKISCSYKNTLFKKSTIISFMNEYIKGLEYICENRQFNISDINIFKKNRKKIL